VVKHVNVQAQEYDIVTLYKSVSRIDAGVTMFEGITNDVMVVLQVSLSTKSLKTPESRVLIIVRGVYRKLRKLRSRRLHDSEILCISQSFSLQYSRRTLYAEEQLLYIHSSLRQGREKKI
jgi:hypothetical protein